LSAPDGPSYRRGLPALGAFDFITKPFDLRTIWPVVKRLSSTGGSCLRIAITSSNSRRSLERTLELNDALREIEESYRVTLEALVASLDIREHETQAHSQRVRSTRSRWPSAWAGGDELLQVGRGALLHDVGKIGVRDSILLKAGPLTALSGRDEETPPDRL